MKNLLTFTLFLYSVILFSQVGVGTTAPNQSAILDISSSDKGFLMPRMDKIKREQINNPAPGLLVYQTNDNKGFYYFDGNNWQCLSCGNSKISVCDYYMGGIVFYVEANGSNSIIVALNDIGNRSWEYRQINKNTRASGLFGGEANTKRLWSNMVKKCNNYKYDNYSGWYLPSIGELVEINNNLNTVNTAITNNGGTNISNSLYWSSTEYNSNNTKAYEFNGNQSVNQDKNSSLKYRAVRKF